MSDAHKLPDGDNRLLVLAVLSTRFLDNLIVFADPASSDDKRKKAYADTKVVVGTIHQITYEILNAPPEKN